MENQNVLRDLAKKYKEKELLEYLKLSYKITINNETHEPECMNGTQEDVQLLTDSIKKAFKHSNNLLMKESFRCLRNCAIKNKTLQTLILNTEPNVLLEISKGILLNADFPIVLKHVILTFLINLCIGNSENGKILFENLDFKTLMQDNVIKDKILALAYNIFLLNENLTPSMELFTSILRNTQSDCEFAHFIIELFIKNATIFQYYEDIKNAEDRIIILQYLKELQLKMEPIKWSKSHLEILTKHFKIKSDCILKTVAEYVDKIEPFEVALLADVIASLSSDEKCLKMMQFDRSLFVNCAFLLKSIHDAGKQGDNNFAPVGKLAKAEDIKEEMRDHPAFGFRVNMIRILGNMAWKRRCNQDEMRELDIIPLLLDSCNIDGRNPFIIQWVIFAIRNICENNIENQKIIASLNKQGVIDTGTLNELGLTLQDDGENVINIAPLKLN